MSLRLILAATAALALAAPVLAQEPPTQPVAAAEEAKSPEVLAFEARAAAFSDRLALFKSELEAAIEAGADDVQTDDDGHWIYCAFESINEVSKGLEGLLGEASTVKAIWKPPAKWCCRTRWWRKC